MTANAPQEKAMDGPVKQVDPVAKTVRVGWLFGLLSTTLDVNDTRIAVEGTTGSLQDIREGDEVKASYEVRDGKNIARSMEVTEVEAPPQRAPAPSGSPPAPPAPQTP